MWFSTLGWGEMYTKDVFLLFNMNEKRRNKPRMRGPPLVTHFEVQKNQKNLNKKVHLEAKSFIGKKFFLTFLFKKITKSHT